MSSTRLPVTQSIYSSVLFTSTPKRSLSLQPSWPQLSISPRNLNLHIFVYIQHCSKYSFHLFPTVVSSYDIIVQTISCIDIHPCFPQGGWCLQGCGQCINGNSNPSDPSVPFNSSSVPHFLLYSSCLLFRSPPSLRGLVQFLFILFNKHIHNSSLLSLNSFYNRPMYIPQCH